MRRHTTNIFRVSILVTCFGSFFLFLGMNLLTNASVFADIDYVYFPSPNGDLVSANVYYPRFPVQRPYPVIILAHGQNGVKDLDLRLPVMMCKRGFAVISFDQSGHGHTFGRLRSMFWQNGIGALDFVHAHPSIFNTSAIGFSGQSLGGWTTLMCMANDTRIQAAVAWAPLCNITDFMSRNLASGFTWNMRNLGAITETGYFLRESEYEDNNPATLFKIRNDSSNPVGDLLIIHGTNDQTVPYDQAVAIQGYFAANSSLVTISGGDHTLINYEVVRSTVSWFEQRLLGADQSPALTEQDQVFFQMYFLYLCQVLLGLLSMGCLIFVLYYFLKDTKSLNAEVSSPRGFRFAILLSLPALLVLLLMFGIFIIMGDLLFTMILGSLALLGYSFFLLLYFNRSKLSKEFVTTAIKNQFHPTSACVGLIIGSAGILLITCLGVFFNIIFVYPLSIWHYLLSLIYLLPVVISSEIFYRKIIQDNIPGHRWIQRIVTCFLIIFGNILFSVFIVSYFQLNYLPQTIALVMFVISSLSGTYLYAKTNRLDICIISSLMFFAFGFANLYNYFPI